MEPIRRIVAATDFSACGQHAARRGGWLAQRHGAGLTVLHVHEPDALLSLRGLLEPARDFAGAVAEQSRMHLAALAQEIEQGRGVRVQQELRAGRVLEELRAAAAAADLLVLGAQGASPVREIVLGTTAERLVRLATQPVLVVRAPPAADYRRVLVGTDFSAASEAALQAALRLAPDAAFQLLHCYDVPFEGKLRLAGASDAEIERLREHEVAQARAQLQAFAQRAGDGRAFSQELRRGDPRLELLQAEAALDADLLVLGKQGRSLVGDTLLGSLTSWAIAESRSDVLVVPAGTD